MLRFNNSKEVYIWNNGFWYILYQWHDEFDEDFNADFYFDNVYQNFTLTIFMRILPWQFEFLGNRHLGCCDHWMQIGESSSNQYTALWCSCQPDLAKPAIHKESSTISLFNTGITVSHHKYREHQSSQMLQIYGYHCTWQRLLYNQISPEKVVLFCWKNINFSKLTCYFFKFNYEANTYLTIPYIHFNITNQLVIPCINTSFDKYLRKI